LGTDYGAWRRYIKLLQQALLTLPAADTTALYRGLNKPQPPIVLAELQSEIEAAVANVWWAFSSTSTSRTQAEIFHGREGERVLFIVRSGSARDVRRYSAIPAEDELLMPCV
jgi:hypothetical protein